MYDTIYDIPELAKCFKERKYEECVRKIPCTVTYICIFKVFKWPIIWENSIRMLSKEYLTSNFPAHSSDARAAPLCTEEGDSLMRMLEFFLRIRVCQSLPAGR